MKKQIVLLVILLTVMVVVLAGCNLPFTSKQPSEPDSNNANGNSSEPEISEDEKLEVEDLLDSEVLSDEPIPDLSPQEEEMLNDLIIGPPDSIDPMFINSDLWNKRHATLLLSRSGHLIDGILVFEEETEIALYFVKAQVDDVAGYGVGVMTGKGKLTGYPADYLFEIIYKVEDSEIGKCTLEFTVVYDVMDVEFCLHDMPVAGTVCVEEDSEGLVGNYMWPLLFEAKGLDKTLSFESVSGRIHWVDEFKLIQINYSKLPNELNPCFK